MFFGEAVFRSRISFGAAGLSRSLAHWQGKILDSLGSPCRWFFSGFGAYAFFSMSFVFVAIPLESGCKGTDFFLFCKCFGVFFYLVFLQVVGFNWLLAGYGVIFFACGFSSSFVLTQKKNETRRKSQGCVCEATAERPDRRAKRNSLRSDSVSPLPPDSSLRLTPLRRGRSFYAKALRCLREWLGERNAAILRPEEFFLCTEDEFLRREDKILRTEIFYDCTLIRGIPEAQSI